VISVLRSLDVLEKEMIYRRLALGMGFLVLIEFWQDLRRSYFKSVWFGLKFTKSFD